MTAGATPVETKQTCQNCSHPRLQQECLPQSILCRLCQSAFQSESDFPVTIIIHKIDKRRRFTGHVLLNHLPNRSPGTLKQDLGRSCINFRSKPSAAVRQTEMSASRSDRSHSGCRLLRHISSTIERFILTFSNSFMVGILAFDREESLL